MAYDPDHIWKEYRKAYEAGELPWTVYPPSDPVLVVKELTNEIETLRDELEGAKWELAEMEEQLATYQDGDDDHD